MEAYHSLLVLNQTRKKKKDTSQTDERVSTLYLTKLDLKTWLRWMTIIRPLYTFPPSLDLKITYPRRVLCLQV